MAFDAPWGTPKKTPRGRAIPMDQGDRGVAESQTGFQGAQSRPGSGAPSSGSAKASGSDQAMRRIAERARVSDMGLALTLT